MSTVRDICRTVRTRTDDIMARWQATTRREPGLEDAAALDVDSLPEVVQAGMDAVMAEPDAETARRALVKWGIEHGRDRVQQGVDEGLLFKEYYVLRQALWEVVREEHGVCAESAAVITSLDAVLSAASQASLRGYFHEHFGEAGGEAVADLVARSAWPPPLTD